MLIDSLSIKIESEDLFGISSFSKSNLFNKVLFRKKYEQLVFGHETKTTRKAGGRMHYPHLPLNSLLWCSPFCCIPGPRHIGTANELGVTNIITKGVAPSGEISLPPPNSQF